MNGLFQKKAFRIAAVVIASIAAVYALIYVDVVLRARSAYLEGEKYWSWYQNPALKQTALAEELKRDTKKLDDQRAKGKVVDDEYTHQLEILTFANRQKLEESSIKYAYIWYQTVVELFSPPESRYVRKSREKMPQAKELWKQELRAKKIPFEEYMLD